LSAPASVRSTVSSTVPDILYNDEIQKTRETYYREAKVLENPTRVNNLSF
jgi:hypothetical protein